MSDASSSSSSSIYRSQRNVSLVMLILICALIVDNLLYAFLFGGSLVNQLNSAFGISLFTVVVAVSYGSALYLLSRFISPLHREIKTHYSRFNSLYKTLLMAQYTSGGIIAFMILQLILTSHYYVGLLIAATAISFTLSVIIMTLSSYRFLSWKEYTRLYGRGICGGREITYEARKIIIIGQHWLSKVADKARERVCRYLVDKLWYSSFEKTSDHDGKVFDIHKGFT